MWNAHQSAFLKKATAPARFGPVVRATAVYLMVGQADLVVRDELPSTATTASSGEEKSLGVLANIDAMILAVEEATSDQQAQIARIIGIHKALMANAHNSNVAGKIRAEQNWIGGNDYNPYGADFVRPPHEEVGLLLDDFASSVTRTSSRL